MTSRTASSEPCRTWSAVKRRLADFDRDDLMALLKDLYTAGKDNRIFLHTGLGLGADPLAPYKTTIARWMDPDVRTNQRASVVKAQQAITAYRNAAGDRAGLAELTVFYCEQGMAFVKSHGVDDWGDLSSVLGAFKEALRLIAELEPGLRALYRDRLEVVCEDALQANQAAFEIVSEALDLP